MFAVLRRFKRKTNAVHLAPSVSRHAKWDEVMNDLCGELVTNAPAPYNVEQFKTQLYLNIQMELFFRTATWFPVSALMVLEGKTNNLNEFAHEVARIEHEIRNDGSPFSVVYGSHI